MSPPVESMIARAETQGELKVIERQLVGIELILQKMHGKLDILSETIASTNLRLAVLDEKLKDYDNIKKSIADLQDSKTRMTVVFSIGAFVISAITSLLIKLVH